MFITSTTYIIVGREDAVRQVLIREIVILGYFDKRHRARVFEIERQD